MSIAATRHNGCYDKYKAIVDSRLCPSVQLAATEYDDKQYGAPGHKISLYMKKGQVVSDSHKWN